MLRSVAESGFDGFSNHEEIEIRQPTNKQYCHDFYCLLILS